MITIDQLLESVDLGFEPRFVTKDKNGMVWVADKKPCLLNRWWERRTDNARTFGCVKLSEFDGKDWTECIYEIKQKEKPVAKIEKLNLLHDSALLWGKKINDLVEAVNEINENYACIAALTDIRKRLDTLEKCVKNKRGEE